MVPQSLEDQKKASEKLPLLGHLTWWSVHQVRITHEDLKQKFETAGLPVEWLIDEPEKESAFLRACHEAPGLHNSDKKNRLLVRQILKSVERFVFGVVNESIDQAKEGLDYNYACKITFDRKTASITSTNDDHPAVKLVRQMPDHYAKFHDSGVFRTQILICLEKLQKLNLRDRGGVYFIPQQYEEILGKLEGLVNSTGDSRMFTMPQIDVIKSREAMVDVFLSDFESEVQAYKNELEAFEKKGDSVRDSTLEKRIEIYQALRKKVELYSELLQFEPKEVKEKIGQLESNLSKIKFGRKVRLQGTEAEAVAANE